MAVIQTNLPPLCHFFTPGHPEFESGFSFTIDPAPAMQDIISAAFKGNAQIEANQGSGATKNGPTVHGEAVVSELRRKLHCGQAKSLLLSLKAPSLPLAAKG